MNKVLVVAYQKIGTPPKNSPFKNEWTSPARLTRLLDAIKKRNIPTVTPEQIAKGELPAVSVLLLFLDGYRSFYEVAYPLLKERGLSACVCVPTAYADTYNSWQDPHQEYWQDLLTWKEIDELKKDPLVAIGVQALNREDVSPMPADQARFVCEESVFRFTKKLGISPACFAAFPSGQKRLSSAELLPDFTGLWLAPGQHFPEVQTKWLWGKNWATRFSLR